LVPKVAVNASYFRRWFGNFQVTDNLAFTPSDYDPYCVTAPLDSRLPSGGGQRICGLFDLNPSKSGGLNNLITNSASFGSQLQHWNGVDLTVKGRGAHGLLLQGGLSTGKTMTDNCNVVSKINNPSTLYCHVETPFLTSVKLLGAYTLPLDLQLAATFQSNPGPAITASALFTNAQIATSLGRNLAAGMNGMATVPLISPGGSLYGERMNEVDLRLAKRFAFGRTHWQGMFDLYNALNANPVITLNTTYGTTGASWLVPTTILSGRLAKFGVQMSF
jgi:hypothetical protein